MEQVLVVRHHDIDSAGFIADAFEARGAELSVHLFPDDGPLPAPGGADHIVVLGAVSSVNDPDPWIAEELAWLSAADQAGVPVLGICFGAQALCVAFGGRVETMERREIGWTTVEPVGAGMVPRGPGLVPSGPGLAPPGPGLAPPGPGLVPSGPWLVPSGPWLVPSGPWLEFHDDRCLPPPAAAVLARNDVAVQAFRIGPHLAVQFHPEVDGPQLKRWLDAHPDSGPTSLGIDPDQFLADTIREEPAARDRAARLVAAFLSLSG